MADFNEAHTKRIITHMNNEHRSSLTAYLRHYAQIPETIASQSPELVDVSPTHLLIRTADKHEHIIPFDPPLVSINDIRPRVIEMDGITRTALGEYRGVIKRYESPRGTAAIVPILLCVYFGCYAALPWVVPKSAAWDALAYFPGGPQVFCWLVKAMFWPVVTIHMAEAIAFEKMRMTKYGIPRFSRLWFKWALTAFIEGFPIFWRIDGIAQKEMKSH